MSPVERAARRTFRSLHTRNFRLYFFGQVVSGTGSWMQLVAQAWLVLHLTHSGVALGLTAAALVACDSVSLPAIAIARAAGIPVVSDVPGLFGWARANDLVAVDGATGAVLVHPSPTEIEKLRRAR